MPQLPDPNLEIEAKLRMLSGLSLFFFALIDEQYRANGLPSPAAQLAKDYEAYNPYGGGGTDVSLQIELRKKELIQTALQEVQRIVDRRANARMAK
jgi:hypothetical protein